MKVHPEGSSIPNFRSNHPPELIVQPASQNILNMSGYAVASEQHHPPYISSQRPSRDSLSRYYTNDTLTQLVATSYPESSQRTIMHNASYLSEYDTRDFQSSNVRNDQTTGYTHLGRSDLDHIPSDHISTTASHPHMPEFDVHHYRQDSSTAPTHHHFEFGSNTAAASDQTTHPMSCEQTYPDRVASLAPTPASKRRSLFMTSSLHARRRPSYGPEGLLYSRSRTRDSAHLQNTEAIRLPLPPPSIPMSNSPGESPASLNPSLDGFPCATSDRDPATSIGSHEALDDISSSSVSKRRRSKMHECEVCGKLFPRPSGLQTHMNTHNNVKPFPCGYPGCDRTFTVRSNAKRHLRTHGIVPSSSVSEPPPGPYVIDFNTPTVMTSSHTPQADKAPLKLRWMPPSLTSRTNAQDLRSLSDGESDSDDASEKKTEAKWRLALPIPLCTVLPSLYDERYEERNSYLDAKLYPYHPSQFHSLPGPAVLNPRSQSVV